MEALSRTEQSGVNPVGVGMRGAGSSFRTSSSSSVVSNLKIKSRIGSKSNLLSSMSNCNNKVNQLNLLRKRLGCKVSWLTL